MILGSSLVGCGVFITLNLENYKQPIFEPTLPLRVTVKIKNEINKKLK